MDILRNLTSVLRDKSDKPKAPAPTLKAKMLNAIGVEPRPYRIVVNFGDRSEFFECSREQFLEIQRTGIPWKR